MNFDIYAVARRVGSVLAPVLWAASALAAPVNPDQVINFTGGPLWHLTNTLGTSTGDPFTGTCGQQPGFGITDASTNGNGDAFDDGYMVFIDGNVFVAPNTIDRTGNTLTAGAVSMSGLDVTVQYHFFSDRQLARILVTFQNPTGGDIAVNVQVPVNFGSDNNTTILATSSGDLVLDGLDRWVVTSDGDPVNGDAVNTTVFAGPNGTLPSAITQTVFSCSGFNGVGVTFNVGVPAGGQRSLMFFAGLGDIEGNTNTATGPGGAVPNAFSLFNAADIITPALGLLDELCVDPDTIVNWSVNGVGDCDQGVNTTSTGLIAVDPFDNGLVAFDTFGNILRAGPMTNAGGPVSGAVLSAQALARDPTSNLAYVMLKLDGVSGRVLGTVNTDTREVTTIANTGQSFASMTFGTDGTLYAVTGDGDLVCPECLYTINKTTGVPTLLTPLGNGDDGEVIAFSPADGLIYHWSGNGLGDVIMESIDPVTLQVTDIPMSGDIGEEEIFGAVFDPSNNTFLITDIESDLLTVTREGFGVQITTILVNGEETDLRGLILAAQPADYGDAPAPYPTTLAQNGARHLPSLGGPVLGNVAPDTEPDGLPSANALGDDSNNTDDEDGVVTLLHSVAGASVARVTVSGAAGLLDGWVDFNQDGDWDDAGEQIFDSESVHVGINDLPYIGNNVTDPSAPVYARYRISTAGGLAPTGEASNGEVEDYILQPIVDPSDPTGTGNGNGNGNPGDPPVLPSHGGAFPLVTLAGLFMTLLFRRRR